MHLYPINFDRMEEDREHLTLLLNYLEIMPNQHIAKELWKNTLYMLWQEGKLPEVNILHKWAMASKFPIDMEYRTAVKRLAAHHGITLQYGGVSVRPATYVWKKFPFTDNPAVLTDEQRKLIGKFNRAK